MNSGQLRVGKGYIMVTVGQQGELKENITELHIIVRTTGLKLKFNLKDSIYFNYICPLQASISANKFLKIFYKVSCNKSVILSYIYSKNDTEGFDAWHGQCLEPMTPPPISLEELLPSLLVYR